TVLINSEWTGLTLDKSRRIYVAWHNAISHCENVLLLLSQYFMLWPSSYRCNSSVLLQQDLQEVSKRKNGSTQTGLPTKIKAFPMNQKNQLLKQRTERIQYSQHEDAQHTVHCCADSQCRVTNYINHPQEICEDAFVMMQLLATVARDALSSQTLYSRLYFMFSLCVVEKSVWSNFYNFRSTKKTMSNFFRQLH
ncbi:uncharacterized protein V6R79_022823, partial [Siganus canaliculatus]